MEINIDVVICENTVGVGVRFDTTALEILATNEARINVIVRESYRTFSKSKSSTFLSVKLSFLVAVRYPIMR